MVIHCYQPTSTAIHAKLGSKPSYFACAKDCILQWSSLAAVADRASMRRDHPRRRCSHVQLVPEHPYRLRKHRQNSSPRLKQVLNLTTPRSINMSGIKMIGVRSIPICTSERPSFLNGNHEASCSFSRRQQCCCCSPRQLQCLPAYRRQRTMVPRRRGDGHFVRYTYRMQGRSGR